ncbi:MAG: tryptophan synthase subunit alpha [Candidatus Omnitrophica bacterium]|nr:tryptophan synthase subunit alpha [Candidatus Omnitrophota bacterium]
MRLENKFKELRKNKKKAFIVYIPFGFPSIKATKGICLSLEEAGVDVIELGIPFSDPLADGPIIQQATTAALAKGANTDNFFKELSGLKQSLKIPVVIMSYYNPIFKFGLVRFLKKMKQSGASALINVDMPLEEGAEYIKEARKLNIDTIFFVTPVTSAKRIKKIVNQSRGFIYYISVTGITGPKDLEYASLAAGVKSIKRVTKIPVCVGFGIHSREQVAKINTFSDGVIVGSEIVKFIDKHYRDKNFLNKLKNHVKSLRNS